MADTEEKEKTIQEEAVVNKYRTASNIVNGKNPFSNNVVSRCC